MAGSTLSDSSPTAPSAVSRTLAIIKAHAIKHRFDIESRISSSGFEIIKERQIVLHDDDGGVYELFGPSVAPSLCGDPVWIYVLERHRAVEVWKSVMGDEDPDLARISAPDSLRSLYGTSVKENAVYGSPDAVMADLQINSVFASSPPFPPVYSGDNLDEVPQQNLDEDNTHHSAPSSASVASASTGVPRVDVKSKTSGFKARPLPATHAIPSIQPRTSRAAALRAGVEVPAPRRRTIASRESIAKTFENVPGHKRALNLNVASTAPPTITPRPTRASALRTGQDSTVSTGKTGPPTPSTARKPNSPERIKEIFADVPGHKRRQTIMVASTAPPVVAPRPTRASMLRTGQGLETSSPKRPGMKPLAATGSPSRAVTTASSSSRAVATEDAGKGRPAVKKIISFEGVPGHKRSTTIDVVSTRPPSATPRINRSAALRLAHRDGSASTSGPPSSFFMRTNSTASVPRSSSQASLRPSASVSSTSARSASVEPGEAVPRAPSATPRPPSIAPRSNRSALLRAKMGTPTPSSARKVFAF